MSFNAIHENKIIAKISDFIVILTRISIWHNLRMIKKLAKLPSMQELNKKNKHIVPPSIDKN